MHKRILCMLLAALVLLSLVPVFALPSKAASNMKLSEVCVEILKEMEGFAKYPYYDHGHYSVGYGSSCGKDDYPNGITEEEADALMREFLAKMEEELNKFANRQNILFSQNQFDALMLFTYNCGSGWLYADGDFRQAVIDNAAGNEFIFWISQWSSASGQLLPGLVTRRLIEADMYLYGGYTNKKPSNFTYVLYNNNGGESKCKVQGYDCNLSACVQPVPTRDGYKFLGWYTAEEGGSWVTELTSANAEQTLYAHWQANSASHTQAAAASYQVPSALLVSRYVCETPGGKIVDTLSESDVATIQADFVDAEGNKWGRLPDGGWVELGNPRNGIFDPNAPEEGIEVTVTGDFVNVRVGPGTTYNVIAGVVQGDKLVITETVDVDGVLWGRFRAGWICLQYTSYSGGLTPGQPEESYPGDGSGNGSTTAIATGTITVEMLNIRSAVGTNSQVVGCYKRGDKVEILEKVTVSGTPWGRTDKGWICLTYVKLNENTQTPETSAPTEPESTVPETTVPDATEGEQTKPETVKGIPATVISKSGLNIRAGAGNTFAVVGAYTSGQKISILEQKTISGVAWGRTDKGWVSMQYVRLDQEWTHESGVYAVVTSNGGLNIRSGAGVGYAPVGNYSAGQRIIILQQKTVGGVAWGRTDKGWVCMTYVRLEQSVPGGTEPTVPETTVPETTVPETTVPETTVPETTVPEVTEPETSTPEDKPFAITGTVTASGLNVRATPGVNGKIVGGYRKGDKITILEQTVVNSTAWGRTDKGWVSLAYVKLDEIPITPDAPRIGVITASSLCIRKGPGTGNAVVGTYSRGTKVTIVERVKVGGVNWGRTDKGWICMDYVQITAEPVGNTDNENVETPGTDDGNTGEGTVETPGTDDGNTGEGTVETPGTDGGDTGEGTVETPGTEESETVPAFDFTYEAFVSELNAELASYDIVAKSVSSGTENTLCYEFVAISDNGSYGVLMYIELAENGKKAAGVTMVCDTENEVACENLAAFAIYAMMIVDDTITEADLQKMMNEPQVDADGNQYCIMERESGEYAFVVADDFLYFYMYPIAE